MALPRNTIIAIAAAVIVVAGGIFLAEIAVGRHVWHPRCPPG
jgi:hypothetical protein